MSGTETLGEAPPAGGPPPALPGAGTWTLSRAGIATVARLELRQRVRSTRWIIVLALWGLVLIGLAALIHHAVFAGTGSSVVTEGTDGWDPTGRAGAQMYGWVVVLVLVLGSLVAPALSATSINGDRSAGVLATLQATLLSPAEIALGKLLAAWVTALALLAVASPALLWAVLSGGTPAGRLVVTVALLAVVLLLECAIGLGWSAVTARTASSAVLTYLSVAFLGLGLPMLFGLLLSVAQRSETVTERVMLPVPNAAAPAEGQAPPLHCVSTTTTETVTHYEWIAWLLVPNPLVVIADASPPPRYRGGMAYDDVLTGLRSGVRTLRLGPAPRDSCYEVDATGTPRFAEDDGRSAERERLGAVWPYGLATELAIGAAFTVITVRRLRAPVRTLARGTRVA